MKGGDYTSTVLSSMEVGNQIDLGKYLTIKKSSESINNKYVYYYELQDKYGNKKIFKNR